MKAVQVMSYGAADVLRINEVTRPAPGAGEVLVSVEASSVNGHDVIVRAGGLKMVSGRRFPIGVGLDFAGVVAATGAGVEGYQVGDRVWGTVHPRQRHTTGGAAEYVVVPADRVAPAPADVSPVEAASLVVAGATALIALRDNAHLAAGERILVRGAAGGVGTAAVQLAHAMGAHVTARPCRTRRSAS
jgi:NADPH:quinone reductase-like Zn-dependent oxidoreductase